MRRTLLFSLALLVTACGDDDTERPPATQPEVTEAPDTPPLDVDDPSACAPCHAQVVEEWRTSMHAHAHHDADPIYAAMRRFRMGREGDELAGRCAQCHGPRDPEHPDSEVSRVGVGCASCHLVAAIDTRDGQRKGARAITWSEGVLRGPHDIAEGGPAPHGVGEAAAWITDGHSICLTCHEAMQNSNGVDTCTTGTEYAEAGEERACTSCHMPEVEGASGAVSERSSHRSHAFLGPHGLWAEEPERAFMASAVELTGTLDGTSLAAELRNTTGHAMPSGFPGRTVIVRATGYDADGEAVWHNFDSDPMAEDPDAVLNKVYVDAEGAPTMPPYGASISRDQRLDPGESRALRWTVPQSVVRAELVLLYRLLPTPAARTLGISDSPVAEPRPFLTLRVE